ncbi:MAG: hypothetical protein WD534_06180 [Phycisphaeraceae bacterium]
MADEHPQSAADLTYTWPQAGIWAGVARCDVTPPVGIYARMWGAASHDRAEGVHRPITATVLAFRRAPDAAPLLLISLDWVFIAGADELALLREPLLELAANDTARILFACTHTHATGLMALARGELPGGEMIRPYLEQTRDQVAAAAQQALAQSQQTRAMLTWARGKCLLAANRDQPAPHEPRELSGFNPRGKADDALLVGRLTDDRDDRPLATLVNYACHATTLGWENRLLSPDYIGALREMVESATRGAPCAFLQGASGELAPQRQYVADPAVADAHGRQLGHAVLAALASLPPPRQRLVFERVVESGSPLGVWKLESCEPPSAVEATQLDVALPLKPSPPVETLERELASQQDRVQRERLRRQITRVRQVGTGPSARIPAWVWRIGDTLLLAHPNEAYSELQRRLRDTFPEHAVVVMNVTNGWNGYLYPQTMDGRNSYPVWQSPFTANALATLTDQAQAELKSLVYGL